jgi:hypothetical protein
VESTIIRLTGLVKESKRIRVLITSNSDNKVDRDKMCWQKLRHAYSQFMFNLNLNLFQIVGKSNLLFASLFCIVQFSFWQS